MPVGPVKSRRLRRISHCLTVRESAIYRTAERSLERPLLGRIAAAGWLAVEARINVGFPQLLILKPTFGKVPFLAV